SRLLNISKSSVQRVIERIASKIKKIDYQETEQVYEMDELRTYCGNKQNESWVMYAINKTTGKVIDFCVGRRTKENLKKITESILILNPKKIYTDGLTIYKTLIPEKLHKVFVHCTNKIERKNLSIRTHLKRLSRKTICFTRSNEMLENCLRMYFV
ncbi:MAG: IS1 family transposase, partial [Bacteroidales bacterium]|nr:IS1 family transposase [Bacteroidales bacterium]